jgi:murein DD-endopeptidase MepM/ murein hydrolase activator NlpD
MDPAHAAGNYVMLEVAPRRFLLLAHLQAGSVVLRVGDQVRRGAVVGRCGNSGNTSEPHLHVHLQDQPGFGAPDARGAPLLFADVIVDGARLPAAAPARGRFVQRAAP